MKGAASSVVVSTRSRMPAITGDARSSVRVVSRGNSIVVAAGSARAPYYGWLDFGGTLRPTGRRRNTITRPRVKGGRYLFPAIKANESRIVRDAEIAFEVAKRKVGF